MHVPSLLKSTLGNYGLSLLKSSALSYSIFLYQMWTWQLSEMEKERLDLHDSRSCNMPWAKQVQTVMIPPVPLQRSTQTFTSAAVHKGNVTGNSHTCWEPWQRVQVASIPEDLKPCHRALLEMEHQGQDPLPLDPLSPWNYSGVISPSPGMSRSSILDILMTLNLPIPEHGITFILCRSLSLVSLQSLVTSVEVLYTFC